MVGVQSSRTNLRWLEGSALFALFGWAYWTTLADLVHHWGVDPLYSHGFLVPGFALLLLWLRKDQLNRSQCHPAVWSGVAVLILATVMRLLPLQFYGLTFTDRYSIIPCLCGLTLLIGGFAMLRWAWPGIAFLVFMIHFPAGIDQALATPLQRVATRGSTNALQTLGFFAEAEGNVILLTEGELNIVEACSGLRMFVTFCALTTAVAILMDRSIAMRLIVLVSTIPLAVFCNVFRIVLTGIVQVKLGPSAATWFHDEVGGWVMVVLALLLIGTELILLSALFPRVETSPMTFAPRRSSRSTTSFWSAASLARPRHEAAGI